MDCEMEKVSKSKEQIMLVNVIEPNKCIIEDLEILGFENEAQLNYYTVWHEALFDKRRELNAESERERQIIRNEIARKTRQLIGSAADEDATSLSSKKKSKSRLSSKSSLDNTTSARVSPPKKSAAAAAAGATPNRAGQPSPIRQPVPSTSNSTPKVQRPSYYPSPEPPSASPRPVATAKLSKPKHIAHGTQPLPLGLVLHNSSQYAYNTMPDGKKMLRYKLNKMYNKYRGRQIRRNLVNEKQRTTKIETEIRKTYINSWLAYTALQALHLPPEQTGGPLPPPPPPSLYGSAMTPLEMNNISDLNGVPLPMPVPPPPPPPAKKQKKSKNQDKKLKDAQTSPIIATQPNTNAYVNYSQPMHMVYVGPNSVVTYSNRINPQQVAQYRLKSHLLPSSATSKKSSAASYDVYEIMEVLANTNKTNVTITRNSHKPNQPGQLQSGSIYSHSMNVNTPGIVSTQLHHQARSYLDSMSKFYAEERQRIQEEEERLRDNPSDDEFIGEFLRKFRSTLDSRPDHAPIVSSETYPYHERHG